MKHLRFPERRQRVRVITLKNVAWLSGALFLLFLAYSLYNELRPRNASQERLYERRGADAAPKRKPSAAIEAHPVSDETFAVPQFVERPAPPAPSTIAPPSIPAARRRPPPTLKEAARSGKRISVSGGAEGVRVEVTATTERAAPPDRF